MKQTRRTWITVVSPLHFFALTFTLSWLVWIPLVLAHFGIAFSIPEGLSAIVRLLGVLMPAAAALVLTAASGIKGEIQRLLNRLTNWQASWRWWVAAVLVYPLLLIISASVYNWLIGNPPVMITSQDNNIALVVNVIFLLIAVLGEEIGWHGVALPALQHKYSALKSSLILGLCMSVWHLPFWLLLDTFDQYGLQYLGLNVLFVLPATFYTTWFFNHSKFSLLLPVAFHLSFNIVNTALLPVTLNLGAFTILIAVSWIIMLSVLPHLEVEPHDL